MSSQVEVIFQSIVSLNLIQIPFLSYLTYNLIYRNLELNYLIRMQFASLPIITLIRPTIRVPTLIQIMCSALSTDFKKYFLTFTLNELSQCQKEDKKSENTETTLTTSSLEDIGQEKNEQKDGKSEEKNRNVRFTEDKEGKDKVKMDLNQSKRRQSFERARFQITQALQSSQQIEQNSKSESSSQKEEQQSFKNKRQQISCHVEKVVKKEKKIRKLKKVDTLPEKPQSGPAVKISTVVSLIETIEYPRIDIDRFEIQKKKESLMARWIHHGQLEQKKYNYQIRQRRELKKLN